MPNASMERMVKNLDRRVTGVEQILPTVATKTDLDAAVARLATKEELQAAVALLATKEELQAAVALLATKEELRAAVALLATKEELQAAVAELRAEMATKQEMRELFEEGRRHAQVLFESLQDSIRLVADGLAHLSGDMREMREATNRALTRIENHEVRLVALETTAPGRRRRPPKS